MIKGYAGSATGQSHLVQGKANEDAFCVLPLPDRWIAAVADGVGSCSHAEQASSIAVETSVTFVHENRPIDNAPISIKSLIRTAYNRALLEIKKEADKAGEPLSEYDTTLSLVVYDGERGYFAHVGDGGIIGLRRDGTYVELSKCQRTQDGCVIPLRAGYAYWQIEEIREPLSAVFLATDGIMDKIRHPELEQGLYVPLLLLLADPRIIEHLRAKGVHYNEFLKDPMNSLPLPKMFYQALFHAMRRYGFKHATATNIVNSIKQNGLPHKMLDAITDDKTCVCLYNPEAYPTAREVRYYLEPDWSAVAARQQALLYPGLKVEKDAPAPRADDQATPLPRRKRNRLRSRIHKLWKNVTERKKRNE